MNSLRSELAQPAPPSAKDLRALALRFQTLLERERTRLAQELHENLTQKLTVVSLEMSLMEATVCADHTVAPARLREKAKEIGLIVNDMIHSLRKIKAELRPKVLDEFGLLAALEWQSAEFSRQTGVRCRLKAAPDEIALPSQLATELFRMFQGIMSNIAIHAHARRVTIELKQTRSSVTIKVTDDGRGITGEQIHSPNSLGLLELTERARSVGGEFDIQAAPGVGTTVTIQVPLPRALPASAAAPAPAQGGSPAALQVVSELL